MLVNTKSAKSLFTFVSAAIRDQLVVSRYIRHVCLSIFLCGAKIFVTLFGLRNAINQFKDILVLVSLLHASHFHAHKAAAAATTPNESSYVISHSLSISGSYV